MSPHDAAIAHARQQRDALRHPPCAGRGCVDDLGAPTCDGLIEGGSAALARALDDVLALAEQLRDESARLGRANHARRRPRYGRWALGWGRARWGVALYRRAVCHPIGGSVRSGWELGCADGPGQSGGGRCVPLYDDTGYCAHLGQVRAGGPR